MRQFGLIGYPLGHSFSRKYFTEKFAKEGIIDCSYELFPIESIDAFPALLAQYPQLAGINVTIPYKKQILPFLDDLSQLPPSMRACNCIRIRGGKLQGFNTDIIGFEKSFSAHLKPTQTKALVLGTGGAAEAVWYVLEKLGIAYKKVSRTKTALTDMTYDSIDAATIAEHPIIINTTPLGTFPNVGGCPQLPYHALTSDHYLFDLVYNPAKSLFLQKGEEKAAAIQNGYDMLLYQAEEAWRIWNED